jgi:hypothetical protein
VRLIRPADLGGIGDDVVAEHACGPGVRAQQRGEHADRRRLAGSVRSEDAVHGPGAYGEIDAGDGLGVTE